MISTKTQGQGWQRMKSEKRKWKKRLKKRREGFIAYFSDINIVTKRRKHRDAQLPIVLSAENIPSTERKLIEGNSSVSNSETKGNQETKGKQETTKKKKKRPVICIKRRLFNKSFDIDL